MQYPGSSNWKLPKEYAQKYNVNQNFGINFAGKDSKSRESSAEYLYIDQWYRKWPQRRGIHGNRPGAHSMRAGSSRESSAAFSFI